MWTPLGTTHHHRHHGARFKVWDTQMLVVSDEQSERTKSLSGAALSLLDYTPALALQLYLYVAAGAGLVIQAPSRQGCLGSQLVIG